MNLEQLAREAGMLECIDECYVERGDWLPHVKRFAALIVDECAKVCDRRADVNSHICADRIRAMLKDGE